MWTRENLLDLIQTKMRDYRFILVSHREPYIHRFVDGNIECEQPASGLTVALDPILRASGGVWIAHGSGDADREVVDKTGHLRVPPEDPSYTLRRVWLDAEEESGHYYGLSNQGLWPLCHIVFTRPSFLPEDWKSYREVNRRFADAVLEEAGDAPSIVFIQDYHFALLPALLKQRNPNLVVAQFWHIPWPNPEVFRGFPWKEELLDGMLGNDLLGFHLRYHCQNFLDTVDATLEAKVDRERFEVTRFGKSTSVRPFPISLDFEAHSRLAASSRTSQEMARWQRELGLRGECVGIGIDRIDYTKGIVERFRAIGRFLNANPEFLERFVFVQIGVPSRSRIDKYKALEEEIEQLAAEINRNWATDRWRPIVLIKEMVPHSRLVALHRLADFCLVTSLHDGMNLVSKEYVASRVDGDGVLILSEFAGASRELTDALLINPFDEGETADAIRQALDMPEEERRRRMQRMRAAVEENNIYRWAGKIVSALLKFEFPSNIQADVSTLVAGRTR